MDNNNKITVDDVLNYVFDGESDLEDVYDENDSDFEIEPDEIHSGKLINNDVSDVDPIDNISTDDDFQSSDDEPLAGKASNKTLNGSKATNDCTSVNHNWSWRKKDIPNIATIFKEPDVKPDPHENTSPFEYFKFFVTNDMLDDIAEQTNIYSLQSKGTNMGITGKELELFLGIYFRMGLVKLPSQRSYWETFMTYTGVSSVMARARFENILRNVHFVNNLEVSDDTKTNDRLWKLRPWIHNLRQNFLQVSPEEHHAVDEIMVAFKGKSLLRQYMPNKPHKWGFKLWGRSGVSGYLYDFDVYQGKSNRSNNTTSALGVSSNVVLEMVSTLPDGHNFKVFADNFFTSLALVLELKQRSIFYVGTIRLNRMKQCPLLVVKDLKKQGRGSFDHRLDINSGVIAVSWFDNRAVNLVSSYVGVEPLHTVRRYDRADKKHVDVTQPHIVHVYNQFMGGIDKLDMMCALYKPTLRTRRWYIYIWLHTIQIAAVNAWFLYRRDLKITKPEAKYMQLKRFLAEIAESLTRTARRVGRPSLDDILNQPKKKASRVQGNPTQDVRRDGYGHMPIWNEKRQRCSFCKKNFSYMSCRKCNVWLCINKDRNCFQSFHT